MNGRTGHLSRRSTRKRGWQPGGSLSTGRVSRSTAALRDRSSTAGSVSDRPSVCSMSGPKTMCARLTARALDAGEWRLAYRETVMFGYPLSR